MPPPLYGQLAPWYRLLDPPEDHEEEMLACLDALDRAGVAGGRLLELGSGAGHNALYLARRFSCTLSDISRPMLDLSRELNPGSEHLEADMRRLRLGRVFDAVVIHDSICHMTSRQDLRAALETAFVHLRPGGAAIFAPDCLRETFVDDASVHEAGDADRKLICLAYTWDPDESDETCRADYSFLLRQGGSLERAGDSHVEGLFSRATWMGLLESVGFEVDTFPRPLGIACGEGETDADRGPYADEVFLGRRT